MVGALAGVLGPVMALTVGGALAAAYAGVFMAGPNPVREYGGVAAQEADAEPVHESGGGS
jgi:hypothetical protein